MLLTLKTIQQETFAIEIDPSETVRKLKERIEEEKGQKFAADSQKLIYAGRILQDDNKLCELNIDPSKFLVVMVSTIKPAAAVASTSTGAVAAAEVAPSTASAEGAAGAAAESGQTQAAADSQPAAGPAASGASAAPTAAAEAHLVVGEAYQQALEQLCQMGYPRDKAEQALRVSFNNPERAVQYLVEGVVLEPQLDSLQPEEEGEGEDEGADELGGDAQLEALRHLPQFAALRHAVQQDPSLLPQLLQQIGQSNPQLLQLINQNQARFVQLLNEPLDAPAAPPAANVGGALGAAGFGGLGAGMHSIQVTAAEREAIDRLKALGFPEALVVQAYFACDKNENLAANFLLQQMEEDQ